MKNIAYVPFLAVGNEELKDSPELGDTVKCHRCGEEHRVRYGNKKLDNGEWEVCYDIAFVKCGGETYLCGINGKEIVPDKNTAGTEIEKE